MKEEFIPFPVQDDGIPFFIELTGVSYCDGSYKIKRSKSYCMCVEYIISGEGTVVFGGKKYYPQKGDMYLLPPGRDHFYYSDSENPWVKIWINACGPLIEKLLSVYNPQNVVLFKNADGYEYFTRIQRVAQDVDLTSKQKHEKASVIFHEMLQFLYKKSLKDTNKISKESRIIKEYIDENFTQKITLKELSELVYLSESQVIRNFRRDIGKTPYDYILDLRIERSKMLLKNTRLMVKEIAFNLGFSDEHYFSYLFREKTGKSPTSYRK